MNKKIAFIAGLLFFAFAANAQVYNYDDGEGPGRKSDESP